MEHVDIVVDDLAAAARVTERIHLGVGVMVLALRDPAWAAKQPASLQSLR